jgi:SAM-dependent methyltransferase
VILNERKIRRLSRAAGVPSLFEKSRHTFWTERYVSKHILNAHLDPSTDDASRKPETIKESARWIAAQAGGGAGRRLIDLGCGPGLYCREFDTLGFDVTGVDFAKSSIGHAKKIAKKEGRAVTYAHADYLSSELPGGFDVATLIYGEFCVLSDHDRDLLLWKLRKTLNTRGYFVFDVFTKSYEEAHHLKTDWYFQPQNGFWHRRPHFVLEQSHKYPDYDTCLNQYIVFVPWRRPRTYHIWHRYYSRETVSELLARHRFDVVGMYSDLTGKPFDPEAEWIGLVCRRAG